MPKRVRWRMGPAVSALILSRLDLMVNRTAYCGAIQALRKSKWSEAQT
jgi:hypothetical protein